MNEIVGVIGVGHLARCLVAGFAHADAPPEVVLSPRNAATSRMLADRFGATVAAHPELSLERMVDEFATPGSLTLTAVEAMCDNGALAGINEAFDRALARTRGIGRDTA